MPLIEWRVLELNSREEAFVEIGSSRLHVLRDLNFVDLFPTSV